MKKIISCALTAILLILTLTGCTTDRNYTEFSCLYYAQLCDDLRLPARTGVIRNEDGTPLARETLVFRCIGDFFRSNRLYVFDMYMYVYDRNTEAYTLYVRQLCPGEYETLGEDDNACLLSTYEETLIGTATISQSQMDALIAFLEELDFMDTPTADPDDADGMDGYSIWTEYNFHLLKRWCPEENDITWKIFTYMQDMAEESGMAFDRIIIRDGNAELAG